VVVPVGGVTESHGEQCEGHEEEAHHLDLDSADAIDEEDGGPVARDGGANRQQGLEFGDVEGVAKGIDCHETGPSGLVCACLLGKYLP